MDGGMSQKVPVDGFEWKNICLNPMKVPSKIMMKIVM